MSKNAKQVSENVLDDEKIVFKISSELATKLLMVLIAFFLATNLVLAFFLFSSIQNISKQTSELSLEFREINKAIEKPKLYFTSIIDSSCIDCFKVSSIISQFKAQNAFEISEQIIEFSSIEARQKIKELKIKSIPAIIISGDLNKAKQNAFFSSLIKSNEFKDSVVLNNFQGVFFDLDSNSFKGRVKQINLVNSSCTFCSVVPGKAFLEKFGVSISSFSEIDFNSSEGQALISKYSIKKIPSMIFSEDLKYYPQIFTNLKTISSLESDNSLVLREIVPPYFDADLNKVAGLVSLKIVDVNSCIECFDANLFNSLFKQNFGFNFSDENFFDINSVEGKKLVSDYNISVLPAAIILGEFEYYSDFNKSLEFFGSKEKDNSFVFRNINVFGKQFKFFDLNSNTLIDSLPEEEAING